MYIFSIFNVCNCMSCVLSGSIPDLGKKESRVPVLLVQNPGFHYSGCRRTIQQQSAGGAALDFGSGWDIILPSGWSMAFWIALVYRGAKAVGLRELRSLAFEAGVLTFPDCCPDTPSGAELSSSRADELRSVYNRRPPAKRCNYDKMGVMAPFHCPWLELVRGWMRRCEEVGNDQSFYCVRNRRLLQLLSDMCAGVAVHTPQTSFSAGLRHSGCAIVKVHIVMLGRGAPNPFALICLPTKEDIVSTTHRKKLTSNSVRAPTEPLHRKSSNTDASVLNAVLGSADRPTIGFVVEGGYSHATAKGSAVGFVSVLGLTKLLDEKQHPTNCTTVLVRCTQSLQYRPAVLHVVV